MIGLIVAMLVLFQILRALTPYLTKSGTTRITVSTQDAVHRWNGKFVVLAGFVNVFVGLNQIGAPLWYFAGSGAIAVGFLGFVGVLELRMWNKHRTKKSPVLPIKQQEVEEDEEGLPMEHLDVPVPVRGNVQDNVH